MNALRAASAGVVVSFPAALVAACWLVGVVLVVGHHLLSVLGDRHFL